MAKIISCEPIGEHQTHDLEVEHKDHQFFLANGVLTSNSHAYVYAYNSYHCAWLYTYYEKEWIKACLEKDADQEKTINSVAQLGYVVRKPDINYCLIDEWQILGGKQCLPPLQAIKGIGKTGAEELVRIRIPQVFQNLYDFFYEVNSETGLFKWRWSKFNKKSIAALIQLEAFDSLGIIGEDNLFKNYRHMYEVVMNNFDLIKKGVITEGRGKKAVKTNVFFPQLSGIENVPEDWTAKQKMDIQKELVGTFDKTLLFSQNQLQIINRFNLKCYTEVQDQWLPAWFIVDGVSVAKTSNGKPYLKMKISDGQGNSRTLNYFQSDDVPSGFCVAKIKKENQWLNIMGKIHTVT
jgi:DNA polymerase III alpha subunit